MVGRLPPLTPGLRVPGRVESREALIYAGMTRLMRRRMTRKRQSLAARSSPAAYLLRQSLSRECRGVLAWLSDEPFAPTRCRAAIHLRHDPLSARAAILGGAILAAFFDRGLREQ